MKVEAKDKVSGISMAFAWNSCNVGERFGLTVDGELQVSLTLQKMPSKFSPIAIKYPVGPLFETIQRR